MSLMIVSDIFVNAMSLMIVSDLSAKWLGQPLAQTLMHSLGISKVQAMSNRKGSIHLGTLLHVLLFLGHAPSPPAFAYRGSVNPLVDRHDVASDGWSLQFIVSHQMLCIVTFSKSGPTLAWSCAVLTASFACRLVACHAPGTSEGVSHQW